MIATSMGMQYALDLADSDHEHIKAVGIYYSTGDGGEIHSKAACQGHFARQDAYAPQSNVEALEAALVRAGRQVMFYTYRGARYWFFVPDRVEACDQPAADLVGSRLWHSRWITGPFNRHITPGRLD